MTVWGKPALPANEKVYTALRSPGITTMYVWQWRSEGQSREGFKNVVAESVSKGIGFLRIWVVPHRLRPKIIFFCLKRRFSPKTLCLWANFLRILDLRIRGVPSPPPPPHTSTDFIAETGWLKLGGNPRPLYGWILQKHFWNPPLETPDIKQTKKNKTVYLYSCCTLVEFASIELPSAFQGWQNVCFIGVEAKDSSNIKGK